MKQLLRILAAAAVLGPWFAAADAGYADRPDVRAFIGDMVARHGFVEVELRRVFAGAQRQEMILQAIQAPAEQTLTWEAYRGGMLSERRIQAGAEFWTAHRATLERARREFGVPEELIVAIIGVETFYGRRTGRWRVVDALATLAFDYPPRAPYFREELEHFLLLTRTSGDDVFSLTGSYAGAIGIPQFMPGSYLRYAVDYDGDGSADLRGSATDAIGSVGNFLRQHGWRDGEVVQVRAEVSGGGLGAYADGDPVARHTLADLARAGIGTRGTQEPLPAETRAAVVTLGPKEVRLGFHNFQVLTRYNRSAFYASVVIDLAQVLRRARDLGAQK